MRIVDPDSSDFGFDAKKFSLNLSCSSGKLFLNEYFLISEKRCSNDNSLCRSSVDCSTGPNDDQPGECRTLGASVAPNPLSGTQAVGIHGPVMLFGVGNQFLSVSGSMQSLNRALARLVYVGDPYFNTMLQPEAIMGSIDDGGAIGSGTSLTHTFKITVVVSAVNNPVQIGSRVQGVLIPAEFDKQRYLLFHPSVRRSVFTRVRSIHKKVH